MKHHNNSNDNAYTRNGYDNRRDYLRNLAQEYGGDIVYSLADMLGANEDFDGLVIALEDYEGGY